MEWYFGNEVEDLVVPKDYEQHEVVSSPDSWSQWGINGFGPKKAHQEPAFNGGKAFYPSNGMSETTKSNNSGISQEVYDNGGSLMWNDINQGEFQQFTEEEEARINQMDDIFFNSLLEEEQAKESSEPCDDPILCNNSNMFEGEMVNSRNVGSHGQSNGSSKYLKTHDFSPSTDWGYDEVSTNYQMPEYTSNENSMEESVLNDLERVTAQFTDKTRICFRDAFYRLAESSKQPLNSCQDEEPMLTTNDDTSRAGETEASESKTNVIDRAVANLMFHKFDYEDNENQQITDCNDDAQVPGQDSPKTTTAY